MTDSKYPSHQLPRCLLGIPVAENYYYKFWEMMTAGAVIPVEYREGGLQMGMLLESDIFQVARSISHQYKPAPWRYIYCERGRQTFYLYPDWDFNIKPVNTLITDLELTPQAFGFYTTLFALNQHRHARPGKHWGYIYEALLTWARNQIVIAEMLERKTRDTPESIAELKRLREASEIIDNISLLRAGQTLT